MGSYDSPSWTWRLLWYATGRPKLDAMQHPAAIIRAEQTFIRGCKQLISLPMLWVSDCAVFFR